MNKYNRGDIVFYKKEQYDERVIIMDIHYDTAPEIFYTIKHANGNERQTLEKYLFKPYISTHNKTFKRYHHFKRPSRNKTFKRRL